MVGVMDRLARAWRNRQPDKVKRAGNQSRPRYYVLKRVPRYDALELKERKGNLSHLARMEVTFATFAPVGYRPDALRRLRAERGVGRPPAVLAARAAKRDAEAQAAA